MKREKRSVHRKLRSSVATMFVCFEADSVHAMLRYTLTIALVLPCWSLWADDQFWPLDSIDPPGLRVHGRVSVGKGVQRGCLVFDGGGLLKIKNSERLASGQAGFTLIAWVNPHRLSGGQQMIAAKNQYTLDQRQWSVMIDKDNRFRLYVHQGRWVTVDCPDPPTPGHWYLVCAVVRPSHAELWVNGKMTGQVPLDQPIALTKAPVTLGGVDDNGRLRQNFVGALDEVRLFAKPLEPKQIATAYTPVRSTHTIPEQTKPVRLWAGASFPKTSEVEVLAGVRFHVIKKYEPSADGYGFLHGVALAWHRGTLYASFGHNKGSENTVTEEGRFCVSEDGGKTWSKVRTIDVGLDEADVAVSHGVFLSRGEQLWAFLGAFHGFRKRVHTRAYTLNETTGQWDGRGTVVRSGFWPMTEPVKMEDGNWVMPGFIVGRGNPAAVAISDGDDLTNWKTVAISPGRNVRDMWGESTLVVDGPRLLNIARYGGKPLALVASSGDYGRTWTASSESNLPMACSKPCAGTLSSGQRYLICSTTADGGNRRSPLTIAVSRRGEKDFSRLFVIRHAIFENGPGESDSGAALSYPYATEYRGNLYVGYSNNGNRRGNDNSAELAIIPIQNLDVE